MNDEFDRLESTVAGLARTVAALEARLEALERGARPASVRTPDPAGVLPAVAGGEGGLASALTVTGRTVLGLGGAFLLRAVTDEGLISRELGVALGLLYSLVWIGLAARPAATTRRLSASFFALTGALVAFPLLWETTARFRLLGPWAAAAGIAAVAGLGLLIADRRGLRGAAWIFTGASVGAAWALAVSTRALIPFTGFTIALGLGTLWVSYRRDWRLLRWPAAVASDLMVLLAVFLLTGPAAARRAYPDLGPASVELVAVALLAVYLGSIGLRTLARRREVAPFEVVQAVAALVLGFGGSVRIVRASGEGAGVLGGVALAAAAAAYALAFAFVERRSETRRNFYFYGWLGLLFALAGCALVAGGPVLTALWGGLGVISALAAALLRRHTLRAHGAVYLAAAAAQGGLFSAAGTAFGASGRNAWPPFGLSAALAAGAAAIAWAICASDRRAPALPWPRLLPRLVLGALVLLAAAALGVRLGRTILPAPAPHVMAAIRSVVLTGCAVALVVAGRRTRLRELAWLVYPVIALGGIKLVVEDLPRGRPVTLFVGLAAYGIALMLASRTFRGRAPRAPEES